MMTLNHGFSGYICARAAMPALLPAVRRIAPVSEGTVAFAWFIGAMLPDVDAVANLLAPGAYFSASWYGHRQSTHSVLGTLLLALLAALPLARWTQRRHGLAWHRSYLALVPCFWAGGLLHLVGDLFTPRQRQPQLWPLPERWGALSHIGWFSPFLFWLFIAIIVADASIRGGAWRRVLAPQDGPAVVFALNLFAGCLWLGYLFGSRYESALQWTAYQQALLPDVLVDVPASAVHAAWHWMVR